MFVVCLFCIIGIVGISKFIVYTEIEEIKQKFRVDKIFDHEIISLVIMKHKYISNCDCCNNIRLKLNKMTFYKLTNVVKTVKTVRIPRTKLQRTFFDAGKVNTYFEMSMCKDCNFFFSMILEQDEMLKSEAGLKMLPSAPFKLNTMNIAFKSTYVSIDLADKYKKIKDKI